MEPQELIANADFVKQIARKLVLRRDPYSDDLAQEAWLVALRKQPQFEGPRLKAWLATTVRNLLRTKHRRDARRGRREKVASIPEGIPSTADIVEQEEARRHVVEAVLALKEPYRTTIILRFYKELSHAEIAKLTDVPIETMRTRLQRGLGQLRNALDKKYGENRKQWVLALAYYAGLHVFAADAEASEWVAIDKDKMHERKSKLSGLLLIVVFIVTAALIALWAINDSGKTKETSSEATLQDTSTPQDLSIAPDGDERNLSEKETIPSVQTEAVAEAESSFAWRGRILDYTGVPIGNFCLRLIGPQQTDPTAPKPMIKTYICDEKGRFCIDTLPPGRYEVSLGLPDVPDISDYTGKGSIPAIDPYPYIPWGEIEIDGTGPMEKDIPLKDGRGGCVRGRVFDNATGKPVTGYPVLILAFVGPPYLKYHTWTDPADGSYCLRCVLPHLYDVLVQGPGPLISRRFRQAVNVTNSDVIEDVDFHIDPIGKLYLVSKDFTPEEMRQLRVTFCPEKGEIQSLTTPNSEESITEYDLNITAGMVHVYFESETLGYYYRSLEIKAGKTTNWEVTPKDLIPIDDFPPVSGTITLPDGKPAEYAEMYCFGDGAFGYCPYFGTTRTDDTGRFTLDTLLPGRANLTVYLIPFGESAPNDLKGAFESNPESFHVVRFRNVIVPMNHDPDFSLDFRLGQATIRGNLFDRTTDLPFEGNVMWRVTVNDPSQNFSNTVSGYMGKYGNEFECIGLEPGVYFLTFEIPGYKNWESKDYSISEGQTLDLGKVYLDPAGTMDLTVLDQEGNPLGPVTAICNNQRLSDGDLESAKLRPGTMRFYGLPTGDVSLIVRVPGYALHRADMTVEAGVIGQLTVTLEPNELSDPAPSEDDTDQ